MEDACGLFERSMDWLRENYSGFHFFAERDVVWTVQGCLNREIAVRGLEYRVFNDFPMLPGKYRSLCSDLAILDPDGVVQVAAEFKYEPSHARKDIWPTKPPVVSWSGDGGVAKDVERVRQFVAQG